MDLYTKSNPNWDKKVEEKVEVPAFTAESVKQDITEAVKHALLMVA